MNIPTDDLKNVALDYAVGVTMGIIDESDKPFVNDGFLMIWRGATVFSPSRLWGDIGKIIDALAASPLSAKITFGNMSKGDVEEWAAYAHGAKIKAEGGSFKEAVCRLYLLCQGVESFEVPHSIVSKA